MVQNQELVEVLNNVAETVVERVARQLISDKKRFSSYSGLSYEQALQRVYPPVRAVIASVEAGSFNPMMHLMDRIIEARLRTGYEPNVVLRVIDLFADELLKASLEAHPNDPLFATSMRRRLTFLNNQTKLHLANINLSIPIAERTEIDPELVKARKLAS